MTHRTLFSTLLSLLLVLILSIATVSANDIAVLTDENFEHDTQATTGSTTGRWLVVFHDGDDSRLRRMLTTPEDEGSEVTMVGSLLDQGVVVGLMDAKKNPKTVKRLKIPGAPHAVILSKGKLYRTNNLERSDLTDFAVSEFEITTPEDIPPLPSAFQSLLTHPDQAIGFMVTIGVLGCMVLAALVVYGRAGEPTPVNKKKD